MQSDGTFNSDKNLLGTKEYSWNSLHERNNANGCKTIYIHQLHQTGPRHWKGWPSSPPHKVRRRSPHTPSTHPLNPIEKLKCLLTKGHPWRIPLASIEKQSLPVSLWEAAVKKGPSLQMETVRKTPSFSPGLFFSCLQASIPPPSDIRLPLPFWKSLTVIHLSSCSNTQSVYMDIDTRD